MRISGTIFVGLLLTSCAAESDDYRTNVECAAVYGLASIVASIEGYQEGSDVYHSAAGSFYDVALHEGKKKGLDHRKVTEDIIAQSSNLLVDSNTPVPDLEARRKACAGQLPIASSTVDN